MSAELPERIRVKISSEAAGEISMTPVVTQEIALRELLDVLLGVCGNDAARIGELLRRGSVVQSASKFRWAPVEAEAGELARLLAAFPQSDPSRRFEAAACMHARLIGPQVRIELPREIAKGKRLLKRRSFWDVLVELAAVGAPEYVEYSYREHADVYRLAVEAGVLRESAGLLTYSGLVAQVERADIRAVELLIPRK